MPTKVLKGTILKRIDHNGVAYAPKNYNPLTRRPSEYKNEAYVKDFTKEEWDALVKSGAIKPIVKKTR
jgi:hypothetical protein